MLSTGQIAVGEQKQTVHRDLISQNVVYQYSRQVIYLEDFFTDFMRQDNDSIFFIKAFSLI